MYARFLNWFSATPAGSFVVKYFASKVDPVVFKMTGGRFTSTGPPTLPQLTMTCVGRKSGNSHAIQLAYYDDGKGYLVVASAMGQEKHPGWRYNIEANPGVEVLVRGETFNAIAEVLSDDEKAEVWPSIKDRIPQMNVYEHRTTRNIRVFRLRRAAPNE